jgi:hypothetical protein
MKYVILCVIYVIVISNQKKINGKIKKSDVNQINSIFDEKISLCCKKQVEYSRNLSDKIKGIRRWYNEQVEQTKIEAAIKKCAGDFPNKKEKATCAYFIRHEARVKAREFMKKSSIWQALIVRGLQIRDRFKYDTWDGPSFKYLFNKYMTKNGTPEEKANVAYQKIYESSMNTNKYVNSIFR